MSVVGVDFGTRNTVIAVARRGGVDVIINEVSERATPSMVGFGPKIRYIGASAKTQEISNLKNTVGSILRLAGLGLTDPDMKIEQQYISAPLVDIAGQVGAEVSYLGKKTKFTSTQLISMFLSKVKAIAAGELKLPVTDIVMSVPAWFTDAQRRSLSDAAEIAGLKLLRLINSTTAAALSWGITERDLPAEPEQKPLRVAFIDIGHSTYTCSIIEFRKGELSVKATTFDRHFGGRDFDKAIMDHFSKDFKEKYQVDISQPEHAKARLRVATAAEGLKKILSTNSQGPFNVENLKENVDYRAMLQREELEAFVEPLLKRVHVPLEEALAQAKLTVEDIDSVKIVGGGARVPCLQEAIQKFFGKELSKTLNMDEAIARGCAWSCAILSPVFRVRDFAIHDQVNYTVKFTWEKSVDIPDEDTALTVFEKGSVMPSTKILTFYRKQTFDLEAKYANPAELPDPKKSIIGKFSVKGVKADSKDDFMICKLKARLNLHGIVTIEQGYFVEDVETEEPIPEVPLKEGETPDPDAPEKPKTRKVKKQVRKGDLQIVPAIGSALDYASKQTATEKEYEMIMEDKLVIDTEEKKNEFEAYIYEMKEKIQDIYSDFASDSEKTKLGAVLDSSVDWLDSDDGYDASKAAYVQKIDDIRSVAGPIVQRYFDKIQEEKLAQQEKLEAEQRARREAAAAKKSKDSPAPPADKDEEMPDVDGAAEEILD